MRYCMQNIWRGCNVDNSKKRSQKDVPIEGVGVGGTVAEHREDNVVWKGENDIARRTGQISQWNRASNRRRGDKGALFGIWGRKRRGRLLSDHHPFRKLLLEVKRVHRRGAGVLGAEP